MTMVMSSIMSDKMHISYGLKMVVFTGFLAFRGVLAWWFSNRQYRGECQGSRAGCQGHAFSL